MLVRLEWIRASAVGACCVLALAAAHAATTVRTVQSAGSAQMKSAAPGQDGLQSPEFAPTFANWPRVQDGPDAAGASASGSAPGTLANASLKQS
ncbi:MAG: hypothetical protein ABI156_12490, partial [Caldimonas sp.]